LGVDEWTFRDVNVSSNAASTRHGGGIAVILPAGGGGSGAEPDDDNGSLPSWGSIADAFFALNQAGSDGG
jgi:hypothetical protein